MINTLLFLILAINIHELAHVMGAIFSGSKKDWGTSQREQTKKVLMVQGIEKSCDK